MSVADTPILIPKITFEPVGRCIYCSATDVKLTKEHIIPKALNGTMILPAASCEKCADITKKFEQTVSRGIYGFLRIKRGYQTRRKKERPSQLPITITTSSGKTKTVNINVSDYPSVYLTVALPPPGILTDAPLSTLNPELHVSLVGDPKEVSKLLSVHGGMNASVSFNHFFAWGDFSRQLAKIAHGYLVASLGFEGYIPLLPDLILGRSDYLSHYVGGFGQSEGMVLLAPHISINLVLHGTEHYLVAYIHLMPAAKMPTYQVVAAKITDMSCLENILNRPGVCRCI